MFIDEIPVGSSISLQVSEKGQPTHLELTTTVIPDVINKENKHLIFTNCSLWDEKVVNVDSSKFIVDLYYYSKSILRCYYWRCARVVTIYRPQPCYIISSEINSQEVNRRMSYRLEMSAPAVVQIGENKKVFDAFIHDISTTGFSFNVDDRAKEASKEGTVISAVFDDSVTLDHFRLTGRCKHIEALSRGFLRLGCQLIRSSMPLELYISKKQQEIAQKNKGLQSVAIY